MTKISWTDRTWNPLLGCSRCSPGCDHCYAITVAARGMHELHRGLTERRDDRTDWTGEVRLVPERLEEPFTWSKPSRVFVNSMSDLFHPSVSDLFIADVFAVMALTPQHTYQVLTKRHKSMQGVLSSDETRAKVALRVRQIGGVLDVWPLPNVWMGVSVENERYADMRILSLMETPAAVHWISYEPALGPVDWIKWLRRLNPEALAASPYQWDTSKRIDWIVAGGESGAGARPAHPDWIRAARDQCQHWGVPFHFKQWGAWRPGPARLSDRDAERQHAICLEDDGTMVPWNQTPLDDPAVTMLRVGAKAAGRELDGRTWDEYPDDKEAPCESS